jgi:multiple sugar transport system substrate-binding protein
MTRTHSGTAPRLTRRGLLAGTAAGLGLAGASARAAGPTKITFSGWAFEPQVTEADVKLFMQQNPDITVEYTPIDMQSYNQKMIALFNANSEPDAFYVRDTDLGAWVEAGWLKPIDGMPGLSALDDDIFPFNRQALSYGGKQYGTPYYGDIFVYMYDTKALSKAGVGKPPVTLDELKTTALELKKAGVAEYPILKGYKTDVDGLSEFWSMVLASGGHLFNPALDPIYPTEDKTALGVLEWIMDAMHTWKIMDPRGLEMDQTQGRDTFLAGQGVLTSNVGNAFPRANNKAYSKRAGDIQITRFPGLQDVGKGPMGWTRLYGISAATKEPMAAWRLISFMGGKDKNGAYTTAKDWYLRYGVGYAFKSLDHDPDIIAAQKAANYDLAVRSQQYGSAQARDNIGASWYSDWDRFTQQQIQNVLLRQTKPLEALQASADKARALKKSS